MTTAPKLEPCPWCLGTQHEIHGNDWCDPPEYSVFCSGCTAFRNGSTRDQAIANWNRRAAPSSPKMEPTDLIGELKALSRAYVSLLELGRNRILDLGGACDPVDVMEKGDPALARARAAVASAESRAAPSAGLREEWQPIATAPTDGTWILLWMKQEHMEPRVTVGTIHVEYGGPDDASERITWKDIAGFYSIRATHWMPLPEAPSRDRGDSALLTLSKEGGEVALPHQTIARDE